eukprot:TRINITY_DN19092_c0_g1_i2.p1 TRINITY_DN19092_c0_g1~~TRINITY_DN19092_c0_g1_i2.p1  ORF type:complete len:318 (-),score=55.66 TRINITY_DN19092_c0_g1_i2:138-1091(-)
MFSYQSRAADILSSCLCQDLCYGHRTIDYRALLSQIASHGLAVVGTDIPGFRTAVEGIKARAEDVASVLTYLTADKGVVFERQMLASGSPAGVKLDIEESLGLMAHSIGGHAVLQIVDKISCFGIRFMALLDPVDGLDPYGFEGQFLIPRGIHPEAKLNFTVPTALIIGGYSSDSVRYPSALHWPSCAPEDRSGLHWMSSLRSPKWLLNFTEFGLLDLLDDGRVPGGNLICPVGSGANSAAGRVQYRQSLGGVVLALAAATLPEIPGIPQLSQDQYLLWLESASKFAPLRVTGTFDHGSSGRIEERCQRFSENELIV